MTRRSTDTITVLLFLSLTTVPCNTRRGISRSYSLPFALGFRLGGLLGRGLLGLRRGRLRLLGLGFRLRLRCLLDLGLRLRRRLGGRDCHRGLLAEEGHDARDVAPDRAHARGILKLAIRLLESQVEGLFLQIREVALQLILGLHAQFFSAHLVSPCALSFAQTADHARLDRQLGGRQHERLLRQLLRHAVQLEHDAARMHAADPVFGRALAGTHAHFGRLAADRHVREDQDPHLADALHMTRDGAAGGLDLARGDAGRLHRLQAEGAEVEARTALGSAMDAALVALAVFGSLWRKHVPASLSFQAARSARRLMLHGPLVEGHRVVSHDLALEHPDLHAAGAIGRLGRSLAEIDLGAQRMQRHAAFTVPLHARDFRPAQPAGAVDADAEGAEAHRRLDRALHGAAERDAALQLLRDVVGDQLGVNLGLADLDDVEADFRARHLGKVGAQLLDVGALLADDDARARGVDRDPRLLGRTLDHDPRHTRLSQTVGKVLLELQILMQQLGEIAVRVPARIPRPIDADAQADRIDLLSHYAFSSWSARSRTTTVMLLQVFTTRAPRPRARAWKRFSFRLRPTNASATTRRSTSSEWLFSAFAIAACRTFFSSLAARRLEKVSAAMAGCAPRPRIICATRLTLRGLAWITDALALASVLLSARGVFALLMLPSSPCGRRCGRRSCASARTRRTCGRSCSRSPARAGTSGRCARQTSDPRTAAGWWSAATRS